MVLPRRILFLLALLAFMSGCSGFKVAGLPGDIGPEEQRKPDRPLVKLGMIARVGLKSGAQVTGEVLQISETAITLGKVGNYGLEKTVIPIVEIAKIEVEAESDTAVFLVSAVSAVAIATVVVFVAALLTVDGDG